MRDHNIAILHDTLDTCERGFYETESGRVDLKLDLEHMMNAEVYEPWVLEDLRNHKGFERPNLEGRCSYSVVNTDSFTLAREIAQSSGRRSVQAELPVAGTGRRGFFQILRIQQEP